MLDVHPPHGKMHGVGDFFLHLFTITVGLLIALGTRRPGGEPPQGGAAPGGGGEPAGGDTG